HELADEADSAEQLEAPAAPAQRESGKPRHQLLRATANTIDWGYFSHDLQPVLEVNSGDTVTIETLTQHAADDWERMVQGDPG
ncbi:AraC family transcriptional regulator, partial [Paraburkholderia sp. SIMBA_061]